MKVRRYKRVQRYLNFYKNNFGFSKPFRVLVDGTFCMAALESQINIQEQMRKYLGEETWLRRTECVCAELRDLGSVAGGAAHILSTFDAEPCTHKKRKTPADCFIDILNKARKDKKFFVATQDRDLTRRLRTIPGAPVIFINYNTMLLEKPPQLSYDKADEDTNAKLVGENEFETLKILKKRVLGIDTQPSTEIKKRKRKTKGPHPLSCLKKKKKMAGQITRRDPKEHHTQATKKKRKNKKR